MKIITRKPTPKIDIPAFNMSSTDFVEVLERIFGSSNELKLLTGEDLSESRVELSGIEELKSNITLVETPLSLRFNSLELRLFSYKRTLEYDEDTEVYAQSLARVLQAEKHALYAFTGPSARHIFSLITFALFLYLNGLSYASLLASAFTAIMVNLALYNVFGLIRDYYLKAIIRHHVKQNIFKRNKDALFVAVIAALLGAAAGNLAPSAFKLGSAPQEAEE